MGSTDRSRAMRTLCRLSAGFLIALSTSAYAQFGVKCDASDFETSMSDAKFSDDIKIAIRSICAFNSKIVEINAVFGHSGWSPDLLSTARIKLADLTVAADKAAELSFKTGDPRALGNIRNMYIRLGGQQRWLADEEIKDVARKKKMASLAQAGTISAAPAQPSENATFITIVFQDGISEADKNAFLQAYHVSIDAGPEPDKSFRLRLSESLAQDQLKLVLDSMNSQTNVIKTAVSK